MYGWNGGWGWLWMIAWLALIVAALFLVIRLSQGSSGHAPSAPEARPGPLQILEERFARGEISEQEYRERRRVLEESKR
jgi:putative membrane protein